MFEDWRRILGLRQRNKHWKINLVGSAQNQRESLANISRLMNVVLYLQPPCFPEKDTEKKEMLLSNPKMKADERKILCIIKCFCLKDIIIIFFSFNKPVQRTVR